MGQPNASQSWRDGAAAVALVAGLAAVPAGVYIEYGIGPTLIVAGGLLILVALLLGWR